MFVFWPYKNELIIDKRITVGDTTKTYLVSKFAQISSIIHT